MSIGFVVVVALLGFLFLIAQNRFYATYCSRHEESWRPFRGRLLGPNGDEFRAMLHASFSRDEDAVVERARRLYLGAFGLFIVGGTIALFTLR